MADFESMNLSTKLGMIAAEEEAKTAISYLADRMRQLFNGKSYQEIETELNNSVEGSPEKIRLSKVKNELDQVLREISRMFFQSLLHVIKTIPYAKTWEKRLPKLFLFDKAENKDWLNEFWFNHDTITLLDFISLYVDTFKSNPFLPFLMSFQAGDWFKMGDSPFYIYEMDGKLYVTPFIYDKVDKTFFLPIEARPVIDFWKDNRNVIPILYEGIEKCR